METPLPEIIGVGWPLFTAKDRRPQTVTKQEQVPGPRSSIYPTLHVQLTASTLHALGLILLILHSK
jgi:hypothetical protein